MTPSRLSFSACSKVEPGGILAFLPSTSAEWAPPQFCVYAQHVVVRSSSATGGGFSRAGRRCRVDLCRPLPRGGRSRCNLFPGVPQVRRYSDHVPPSPSEWFGWQSPHLQPQLPRQLRPLAHHWYLLHRVLQHHQHGVFLLRRFFPATSWNWSAGM